MLVSFVLEEVTEVVGLCAEHVRLVPGVARRGTRRRDTLKGCLKGLHLARERVLGVL